MQFTSVTKYIFVMLPFHHFVYIVSKVLDVNHGKSVVLIMSRNYDLITTEIISMI